MIIKNFIKKNSLLTIIADYFISFMGFNFEKEYKLINLIKKKFPIIVDIGGNRGESIKNFLRYLSSENLRYYFRKYINDN